MAGDERERAKAGERASDIRPDDPAKAARKDTDTLWTFRYSKARKTGDGDRDAGPVDISVPRFGCRTHIGIDRKWRFIRGETCTRAARHGGHEPGSVPAPDDNSNSIRVYTGQRSTDDEARGHRSCIHRGKPCGKPMPGHIRRGDATEIHHPRPRRACLRAWEGPHGAHDAPDRSGAVFRSHDHGQPEPRLPPPHLPRATTGHGPTLSGIWKDPPAGGKTLPERASRRTPRAQRRARRAFDACDRLNAPQKTFATKTAANARRWPRAIRSGPAPHAHHNDPHRHRQGVHGPPLRAAPTGCNRNPRVRRTLRRARHRVSPDMEEVLQSHHFRSGEDLATTLHRHDRLYNQQFSQSSLGSSKTLLQAMKRWHK